jgi:uncharacterized repeat protein (TIGR01451 family)
MPRWQLAGLLRSVAQGFVALLAATAATPALAQSPNCGATVPSLRNGSFEAPTIGANSFRTTPTTDPAVAWRNTAENYVEIWSDGFQGVSAHDGNQFAELNANLAGTLYQTLTTIPGTQMVFSLAHKARSKNPETMQVLAGPNVNALTPLGNFASNVNGPDRNGWTRHSGRYTVPASQTSTVFAFRSLDAGGSGNLLDGIEFTLVAGACNDTGAGSWGTVIDVPVLANDIGAGLAVTAVGPVSPAAAGTVSTVGDQVRFSPARWSGTATFPYTIRDASGATSSALVRVTVQPIAGDDTYLVVENRPQSLEVMANDGVANGRITIATPPAQGTATVTADGQRVAYTPRDGFTGTDTFTYFVTGDPNGARSREATVTINVNQNSDVAISQGPLPARIGIGETFSYTVTITNNGPASARTPTVTFTLPAGMALVGGPNCTPSSGPTATCAVSTLAPGASYTFTPQFRRDTAGANLTLAAAVSVTSSDPVPGNNQIDQTFSIEPAADLSVENLASSGAVPGGTASFTFVLRNSGPSTAAASSMRLQLVPAAQVGAPTVTAGGATVTCVPGGVAGVFDCPVGDLASGASTAITVTAPVDPGATAGAVQLGVKVTSTVLDPDPTDNERVIGATSNPDVDLAITGRFDPAPAPTLQPGQSLLLVLQVNRGGVSDATATFVTFALPAGLTLEGAAPAGCAVGAGSITCQLGTLTPGQVWGPQIFPVRVATALAATNVDVTVTVSSAQTDSDPADNTASIPGPVNRAADRAAVVVGGTTAVAGLPQSVVVSVFNNGPADAPGTQVRINLPASPDFVIAGLPSGCSGLPDQFTCTVDLPPGASSNFVLTGTWSAAALGARTFTAAVQPPAGTQPPDPAPANDTSSFVVTVTEQADLEISGHVTAALVAPGQPVFFSMLVTNRGPSSVTAGSGVTLPLPAGLTYSSATGATCSVPGAGTDVVCELAALASGQARGLVVEAILDPSYPGGPIVTTASVTPPSSVTDPNAANDAVLLASPATDVSVSGSFTPASAPVGQMTTLVVVVKNKGPAQAPGVEVFVPLPAGLALSAQSASAGTFTPATGMWQVGVMAAGKSETLTLTVVPTAEGPVSVAITETSGAGDTDPSDDSATATLNALAAVDLQVSLSADRGSVNVGEVVTLTARVVNAGPSVASSVTIALATPPGLSVVSATTGTGTYAPGTWTIPSMAVGAAGTLTITATVAAAGALSTQASYVSSNETEVSAANNTATVVLNGALAADVQVTKQASTSSPAVGGQVTYTVVVRNNGPSRATGIVVTDALDPMLAFASAVASAGTYDAGTGAWVVGALTATQQATLAITATAGAAGQIANLAAKTAMNEPDPVAANDRGLVTVAAGLEADLSVSMSSPSAVVLPGVPVTYTLTVSNAGPSAAAGTLVRDLLPASLLGATWTCRPSAGASQCRTPSGTGDVSALVDLDAGGAVVFTVEATVSPSLVSLGGGSLTNVATAVAPAQVRDPDSTNNAATLSLPGGTPQIDIAVSSVTGPSPVLAGSARIYSVTMVNAGPADAVGATLAVSGPAEVTLAGASPACPGSLPCALPVIPAGGALTVNVTMTVPVPAPTTTTVPFSLVAAVAAGVNEVDTVPGNNTASLAVVALDSAGGTWFRLLPEGVSTDFFATRLSLFNPSAAPATVTLRPLPEGRPGVPVVYTLAPAQRLDLDGTQVAGAPPIAYGTSIEADQPIAAERTTTWNRTTYGSQGEAAIEEPSHTWYFAEGATGGFDLFFLLANPGSQAAVVEARFLPTTGTPVVHTMTVPAGERVTLWANTLPGLQAVETAAVFTVLGGPPIGVSRAMYTDDALGRPFGVGHTGAGLPAPAARLTLSEAAAGYFDLFFLLGNPDPSRTADVRLRFGLEDGTEVTHDVAVPPSSRRNVWVNALAAASADPLVQRLGQSAMATTVESLNGVPVVAERAMYWPAGAWLDGSATSGNASGGAARWAVADAEAGGPRATSTFLLVGNQAASADTVRVTLFFDDGTTAVKDLSIAGGARLTVWLDVEFPQAANRRFAAIVESLSGGSIVVERSTYGGDAAGRVWATGLSAPATRLP